MSAGIVLANPAGPGATRARTREIIVLFLTMQPASGIVDCAPSPIVTVSFS